MLTKRNRLAAASPPSLWVVMDDAALHRRVGALIAIRQLTIGADGTRHAHSPQHIEDEWGFLTDQPIDYADELTPCDGAQFRQIWEAR
jgi:hypothetical protein